MALSSSQYDSIMLEYNQKRLDNRHRLELRTKEVYQAIPELSELDATIVKLAMERATTLLGFNEANVSSKESYDEAIANISARKSALLMQHGYAVDYLEPIYDCPLCQDTGYVNDHKCACFLKAETDLFYAQSNNKNLNPDETFDNFRFDLYSSSIIDPATGKSSFTAMTEIYNECLHFAESFSKCNKNNLLFHGSSGLGKTYLTNCIANRVISQGYSVVYLTATELFDLFAKSTYGKDENNFQRIDDIINCDLLIIDDLGTEIQNSFTYSKLFYCINERILNENSTIISTNMEPSKLYEQYFDRIFSRIIQSYKTLKFFGENIRLKQ